MDDNLASIIADDIFSGTTFWQLDGIFLEYFRILKYFYNMFCKRRNEI